MAKTIQIFLQDLDLDGIKIAEISNKVAKVYVVPREKINYAQTRSELKQPALYMLFNEERTDVYIGECENFSMRVGNHIATKDFWHTAVICIATGNRLDKADVKFLEHHAVQKAIEIGRLNVKNMTSPNENTLHEFKLAAVLSLFEDFELLLTTLGFTLFDPLKDKQVPEVQSLLISDDYKKTTREFDTVIAPCRGNGLEEAFRKKSAWWAIRLGTENIPKLKYVGLYETAPVSAIRYYAKITKIELKQDEPGKYILYHDGNIVELENHVVMGNHPELSLYGPRYFKLSDILSSKSLAELTDKAFGSNYQRKTT